MFITTIFSHQPCVTKPNEHILNSILNRNKKVHSNSIRFSILYRLFLFHYLGYSAFLALSGIEINKKVKVSHSKQWLK